MLLREMCIVNKNRTLYNMIYFLSYFFTFHFFILLRENEEKIVLIKRLKRLKVLSISKGVKIKNLNRISVFTFYDDKIDEQLVNLMVSFYHQMTMK
jgi:hypothetical protein